MPAINISRILEWSGKKIRIFGTVDKPWFHGPDIAKSLGYTNVSKALTDHVKKHNKCIGRLIPRFAPDPDLDKYKKQANWVNKDGVCSLLSRSRLPNISEFIAYISKELGITYNIISNLRKEQEYIGQIITSFSYCTSKRQYKVGTYFIDLYFPIENIAIECDEFDHISRDPEYEITRETFITMQLGCKFVRFNPDSSDFSIFKVISTIGELINKRLTQ